MDSLKNELTKTSLSDSVRAGLLEEIGYHLSDSDPAAGRSYYQKAFLICANNNWQSAMAGAAAYIAQSFNTSNQFDSANYYLSIATRIFKSDTAASAAANLAVAINIQANIDKAQGKFQSAIEHYLASNEITSKTDSKEKEINLGIGYINVAKVFEEMEQYKNAIDYGRKAVQIFEMGAKKTTDPAYLKIIQSSSAHGILGMASDLIHLDSLAAAKALLDKQSATILSINSNDLNASFSTVWGTYYQASRQPELATRQYNKALAFAANIDFRKVPPLLGLGEIYRAQKQYSTSATYFREALQTKQAQVKAKVRAKALRMLADVLLADRQFAEAANSYHTYTLLMDSLNNAEIKIKINEIENRYQSKQKADSILVLTKNNQVQQLALHKKANQNLFILIGAALFIIIGVLFYRNLRHKHLLLKKSEEVQQQQILQLEKERQLIAAQSLMQGQEQERSRMAKDLHDGVGGLLSGVKLRLSTMKGNVFLSEDNASSLNSIIGQLDSSIGELRRVSHNMMPEALIKYGLQEALENYVDSIQNTGALHIKLQTYGLASRIHQDTEIILYRIIQELLTNVIKHAGATEVLVQIIRAEKQFTLTVEDNGQGFDKQQIDAKKGAGLSNIEARAAYLNGQIDIKSSPGQGCSITVEGDII